MLVPKFPKIDKTLVIGFIAAVGAAASGFLTINLWAPPSHVSVVPPAIGVGADVRVLTVPQGGTGAATFTTGECLKGNGTGAITTGTCGSGSTNSDKWATSTDDSTAIEPNSAARVRTRLASSTATDALNGVFIGTTATTSIYGNNATSTFTGGISSLGTGGGLATNHGLTISGGRVIATGVSTSSFSQGINLTDGCFSINDTCVSSGGAGTVTSVNISSTDGTLTVGGGPITGSGILTSILNLASSNVWTAASTTFTNGVSIRNGTTTNATSTNLNVSGTIDFDGLTSAIILAGSSGILAEYAGTTCTNQFVRSLDAVGAATCATVGASDVSLANLTATDSTLTFSGTYNGSTARTIGLNLSNPNTWTGVQTINDYVGTRATVTAATTTSLFASRLNVNGPLSVGTTTATTTIYGNASSTFAGIIDSRGISSSAGLRISGGDLDVDALTSALVLTGAGGVFAEYTGADCTNQFIRDLSALGAPTCDTVGAADVSLANLTATDSTLTFSGTYNGSTARTIGLNLSNANTWTGTQTFGSIVATNATSTNLFGGTLTANILRVGTTSTSTIYGNATSTFNGLSDNKGITTSAGITVTGGEFQVNALTSALTLTGTDGRFAEYAGTSCTNQFVRSLSALGAATCATVVAADVDLADLTATDTTLTFSGTYDGQTARTIGLNLSNANTWTGTQTFGSFLGTNGTSTNFFASTLTANGPFRVGTTSTSTIYGNASSTFAGIIDSRGISTSAGITITGGELQINALTSALTLTGSDGRFAEYAGTSCTNQFVRSLSALGAATCASVNNGDWSGTDLSVANGGTGLSTFGGTNTILYTTAADTLSSEAAFTYSPSADLLTTTNATTTNLTVATFFKMPAGASESPTIAGQISQDTTSSQIKYGDGTNTLVLGNGKLYPAFSYSTSTTWTGTTTIPLGPAVVGETWTSIACFTDVGTLGVSVYDGTNRMSYVPTASTTVNANALTTNNTFTALEKRYVDIGTPASAPKQIGCTITKAITAD